MITDDALLEVLELGSLATPMSPGKTWRADLPNVFVRDSTIASPRANQVALARLSEHDADATIARVRAHYRGRPFGWNVGPRSTPLDLEGRLAAAGLTLMRESAGLALRDLAQPIDAPHVEIRRATLDDAELLAELGVSAFGQDPIEARWLQQLVLAEPRIAVWLALERGDLLGFGQSFVRDDGVLLLVGAATLPHARRRGVYRALLRHRIALARAEGASAAVIQANDETSAPICKRCGFVELCRLRYWVG
ncbi:MAG TPA: GNAT family N-acetyltransferase [Nannocystaceae bacterium]|nr:GNAT family N-acetyltransferase [Nannocystaceae bacterium]